MSDFPTVSVAIPVLNEADHITEVIQGFLQSAYPALIEVLVADGGSTDGTVSIVQTLAENDSRVLLMSNPETIQAAALNRMIEVASGDIFLRADAHCRYAPDYVESCVVALQETGAVNVGGAQRLVARSTFQAGVALAARSILGSGGARYRDALYDGPAETVFLGCFDRQALLEVGGYSAKTTNEDAELNIRLNRRFEHAVHVSSRIRVWYYPRHSWWALWRQYLSYGRGRRGTVRDHPGASPWRSVLPFAVVTLAALAFLCDQIFLAGRLHSAGLALLSLGIPFLFGLLIAFRLRRSFVSEIWRGDPDRVPPIAVRGLCCGLVLLTQPIAHFTGFGYQWIWDGIRFPGFDRSAS